MVKAVLITGAAGGIGRATARKFARAGWFVGLYDLDGDAAQRAAREIAPETSTAGALDVTDLDAWKDGLERFAAATGERLDVLVNNAGIVASGGFVDVPLTRHEAVLDVNLRGVMYGCHAAFEHLRRTPGSRVINLCSASALYGQPTLATYSATKAAIRSLTESLDLEWSPQGVRVHDVLPLFVDTPLGVDAMSGRFRGLGMRLTPDDVATAVFTAATAMPRRTHRYVGAQTRLLAMAARVSPGWMTRATVERLAR